MSFTSLNHRDGLAETCPFCNFAQSRYEWIRGSKAVIRLEDRVMVSTPCPYCSESSWAHYLNETLEVAYKHLDLEILETYPDKV